MENARKIIEQEIAKCEDNARYWYERRTNARTKTIKADVMRAYDMYIKKIITLKDVLKLLEGDK